MSVDPTYTDKQPTHRERVLGALARFGQKRLAGKAAPPRVRAPRANATRAGKAPLEHEIQRDIVAWCRSHGLTVSWTINERKRDCRLAAWQRARGLCLGFPDLLIVNAPPAMPGHHVAVEVKSGTGRVSERQAAIHERMMTEGWVVLVVRSLSEFISMATGLGYKQ